MAWQDREKEWENMTAVQAKIGQICMVWAAIERSLNEMLADLLDITEERAGVIFTDLLAPKKALILRRLIEFESDPPNWAGDLTEILKEIGGELSAQRNRFVHDGWGFDVEKIERVRIGYQRAVGSGQLSVSAAVQVKLDELDSWCERGGHILHTWSKIRSRVIGWTIDHRFDLSGRWSL